MPRTFGFLAVEGPHDLDFTGKILRHCWKLKHIPDSCSIDPAWKRLMEVKIKADTDLYKPLPIPHVYQNETHCIALKQVGGNAGRLVDGVSGALFNAPEAGILFGVGIVTDADKDVRTTLVDLQNYLPSTGLDWPNIPGTTKAGSPTTGIYILPDNTRDGTLENVLLELASSSYPMLWKWAKQSIRIMKHDGILHIYRKECTEFKKPHGKDKATIGLISSILKPGKAVQNTLRDNRWIQDSALSCSCLVAYARFLKELFGLPDCDLLKSKCSPTSTQ